MVQPAPTYCKDKNQSESGDTLLEKIITFSLCSDYFFIMVTFSHHTPCFGGGWRLKRTLNITRFYDCELMRRPLKFG